MVLTAPEEVIARPGLRLRAEHGTVTAIYRGAAQVVEIGNPLVDLA